MFRSLLQTVFGSDDGRSNIDRLRELTDIMNLGKSRLEQLQEENTRYQDELRRSHDENRDLELRNSALVASLALSDARAIEHAEWICIFLIGLAYMAATVARLKQMYDAYIEKLSGTFHWDGNRKIYQLVFSLQFSLGSIVAAMYSRTRFPLKFAMIVGLGCYLLNYIVHDFFGYTDRYLPGIALGFGITFYDGLCLFSLKQHSQRHHFARNLLAVFVIGKMGTIIGSLVLFPTLDVFHHMENCTFDGISSRDVQTSHYVLMFLLCSISIALMAISLLPTKEWHAVVESAILYKKDTKPTEVSENHANERREHIRLNYFQRSVVDRNARIALCLLFTFLLVSSVYSGYTELVWSTIASFALSPKHSRQFQALPQYIFAFDTTDVACLATKRVS